MVIFTTNSVLWRLAAFMLYPAIYSSQGASCSLRDRGNSDTTGKPRCWQDDRHDASGQIIWPGQDAGYSIADQPARPNTLLAPGLVPPRVFTQSPAAHEYCSKGRRDASRPSVAEENACAKEVTNLIPAKFARKPRTPSAKRMAFYLSLDSISNSVVLGTGLPRSFEP